jgi:galactosyl transferase GMA12/MNN10 family
MTSRHSPSQHSAKAWNISFMSPIDTIHRSTTDNGEVTVNGGSGGGHFGSESHYHQYTAHRRRRRAEKDIGSAYPQFKHVVNGWQQRPAEKNDSVDAESLVKTSNYSMDETTALRMNHPTSPESNNGKNHGRVRPIAQRHSRTAASAATICVSCMRCALQVVLVSVVLAFLIHRSVSSVRANRKWINAPITYISRPCPAVPYETMNLQAMDGTAPPPHICITTLTDQASPSVWQRLLRWRNFDGILDLTWSNKQAYALQYDYFLYDGSQHIDHSRPPAWSKIKAVQYLLSLTTDEHTRRCDWVMWTDADTLVMNSHIRITDFLPADENKDLVVGPGKGGGYNSGVWVLRNTAWSRSFLETWWNMTDFVRPHGLSLSGDNAALNALMHRMVDRDDHVLAPPRCTLNSFAKFLTLAQSKEALDHLEDQSWYLDDEHYHKGDFIAHTPGVDNKIACLKLLLPESQ